MICDEARRTVTDAAEHAIVIRPFQAGDEDAFRRLNEEWITRYFRLEEKDRKMLGNPRALLESGGQILMVVAGEERVGCCALVALGGGSFEIAKMAVTDAYQGQGIGRRLLTEVINHARSLGAHRLYLETNTKLVAAIKLYESLGFRYLSPDQVTPSPYDRVDAYMELYLRS
jgi:putative acetyltransferase